MAGETTTGTLADSLPTMRFGARIVLEQKGRMRDTVDRVTLPKNLGNSWSEVDYGQLTAMAITELTDIDENAQQLTDTLRTITPSDSGIFVFYTDRVADRIITEAAAIVRSGKQSMNALLRKEDQDGITVGRAATTDLGTAGNPLTSTLVRHARYQISSNTTERGEGPYHMQHHGFCLTDIDDELTASVGTYEVSSGVTADVFANSYVDAPRTLGGVIVHENGNLSIDSANDSEGFVYSRDGIILVEGRGMRTEVKRFPNKGGGGTGIYMYFEYAYGERSAGNWLFGITADATAPA
jgi:hypothetical protein